MRVVLVIDALTFLTAAALNFGARIPLGFVTVLFPVHIIPAGIGEAVIGTALLVGGITMRRGAAWLGFWLSVGGIAFGLVATSARRGPAWDVHAILVPLALVILGLLVRTGRQAASSGRPTPASRPPALTATAILMLVTAGTLVGASVLHFGVAVALGVVTVHDPFAAAAVPEAVLGGIMALASVFLLSGRPGSWEMALAADVFTMLLSLYGLSGTLREARTGDVAYHITLVGMLLAVAGGLIVSRMPRGGRPPVPALG